MQRTTRDVDHDTDTSREPDSRRDLDTSRDVDARRDPDVRRDDGLTTADLADARAPQDTRPEDRRAQPSSETRSNMPQTETETEDRPLLDETRSGDLRSRWGSIQASFVDEPRQAVEQADGLVAEVLQELARSFKNQRQSLEQEWQLGDDVSTEDLRQALRHYRSFFDRLLSL